MKNRIQYTDEHFFNLGYKKYDKSQFDSDITIYNFQKRFDDEKGKKYFIDVHKVSNEWFSVSEKNKERYVSYSYTYSCQLYKKGTHAPVNMEFFSDWTIDQVEEFVEKLFQNGELDYYEEWDEC